MCRLFGMVSERPEAIRYWMLDAPRPFRSYSAIHSHGWGIGSYEKGQAELVREPVAANESKQFESVSNDLKSAIVICHIRKMTRGNQVHEDTHPFQHGNWLFGHNGTIDADHFREKLNAAHRDAVKGSSDSEVYFHYLLQAIEADGEKGLIKAIGEVRQREFSALNFIMTNGSTLMIFWDQFATAAQSLTPFYYQMYFTTRNSEQAGGKQLIVCSEKLDNENWEEIRPGTLMTVSSECTVRFTSAA